MTWKLWILFVPLIGQPQVSPIGTVDLTRQECLALIEPTRAEHFNWPGATFVWCDPSYGWPAHNWGPYPEQHTSVVY